MSKQVDALRVLLGAATSDKMLDCEVFVLFDWLAPDDSAKLSRLLMDLACQSASSDEQWIDLMAQYVGARTVKMGPPKQPWLGRFLSKVMS